MMKKLSVFSLLLLISFSSLFPQNNNNSSSLLIRCDDIGMSHAVNMAAQEMIKSGIPFSASVMFVCPWYQEAADLLKPHPEISVGVHLTLNAEWKNFRWGPVSGKDAVPSLVDSCGFFTPSRAKFYENNPRLEEIEKELRAQIERGIHSGLKITYVDYHMGTAVDKPEYREIVEKLAREYKLGISRYFGEEDIKSMYSHPVESKLDSLLVTLKGLQPGKTALLVCHIGMDQPELQAMTDLNSFGLQYMSRHRQGELNSLLSPALSEFIRKNNIRLVTYSTLVSETGLKNMKRPAVK